MSLKSSRFGIGSWLIILSCLLLGGYTLRTAQTINETYDRIARVQNQAAQPVAQYRFPSGQILYLTSFKQLQPAQPLGLVSPDNPLPDDFQPPAMRATELPHGDVDRDMLLQEQINSPLTGLFAAAQSAGHPLMISSAYRSMDEQRQVYQDYVSRFGMAAAERYVADVGTSEHHTGLSVDLSDASPLCALDSNNCNLSSTTAAWLAKHAPDYGFILRYPAGKQTITHVGYEPWHYRYVGVTPARYLTASGMTLDELARQIQPGVFK